MFELNIQHNNYDPVCSSLNLKQSESDFEQGATKETIASAFLNIMKIILDLLLFQFFRTYKTLGLVLIF